MVEVPVTKAFIYEGRGLRPGDTVRVSPVVAAALQRRGVVSLTRQYRTAALTPAEPPSAPEEAETIETPVRRRRRYRRRDLTAESA